MSKPKGGNKKHSKKADNKKAAKVDQNYSQDEEIRINKFIAHAGFCSRREADEYISAGKVQVNGQVITELGTKVRRKDSIVVDGQNLSLEPFVYLLLHKSKDVITTTNDEKDRTTVMDQIEDATGYRVYPIGRLDRNTTGLLLLTNDGDLAHRLMHPSYTVRKTYLVTTDTPLNESQLEQFLDGIELEDGEAKGYNITQFVDDPHSFEMSVFEGRNHLIRRMVQFHGTVVTKLKRVEYAGLTLKDVPMGRWRFLRQNEINNLRKLVKLDTLDFNKDN
ncbi:MAG TPA: rRNA pseudouridine synthase [Balneolaceae bacterium]|nr:pseudouridine synthase [Balneola sp.]HBQ59159.1 rRNA pseudouridine synthase [Balneolaceae bacterium]|tara:strand:- start:59156 stop:59986 length:831 start_codon:yes stop_codon:yes gene_type:complete